jgi:hypothetical protein
MDPAASRLREHAKAVVQAALLSAGGTPVVAWFKIKAAPFSVITAP